VRVIRHQAVQTHPVPKQVSAPRGPFPDDLFREPEVATNYDPTEYGGHIPLGGTAQNNYKPPKYLRCKACLGRVLETETDTHNCEE
jgi:hypothetical protein